MRSTMEEGAWVEVNEVKNLKLQGGWIWRISPRSTVKWYTVGNSMGIYPQGLNEWGAKNNYAGHIRSAGVGLLGITYSPVKQLQLQAWNQFTENVFNTVLLQADANIPVNKNTHLQAGMMYVRQDAVHCGGNCDSSLTYFARKQQSNTMSAKLGITWRALDASVNYTHITEDGRFTMPREWGREPFYTFMPRERNEGAGRVHAFTAKIAYAFLKGTLKTAIGYGHYFLPDVKNVRLNKYGMPSYNQINADIRYTFPKYLKGLSVQGLLVYKGAIGNTYNEYKYSFNKVNMFNWNLVVDYNF
ncbi:MAG: outer membrane porin, OprD family [Bacteroidetes bacterium]|nr:outer membrane porin, OprD family [Bacteroidota bacterium]